MHNSNLNGLAIIKHVLNNFYIRQNVISRNVKHSNLNSDQSKHDAWMRDYIFEDVNKIRRFI